MEQPPSGAAGRPQRVGARAAVAAVACLLNGSRDFVYDDPKTLGAKAKSQAAEPSSSTEPAKYECRTCGQRFQSAQQLGGHQNLHRNEQSLRQRADQTSCDDETAATHPDSTGGSVDHRLRHGNIVRRQEKRGNSGGHQRTRPTNNQLLYKVYFQWEHFGYPVHDESALPAETEPCASVTSAFLRVLSALFEAEKQRKSGGRNILRALSTNTRRTKVVELSSGTHRVPDELKRHTLVDADGHQYSTNLDRNRYGSDDNYLSTVIRYNLEFLGLCPALVDVEIIDSKNRGKGQLVSVGPMGCTCHSAHARPGSLPPQAPLHAPARLPATHHSVGHPSHWVAPSPRSLAPLGVGMPPLGAAPALSQRLRERSSLFEDVGAGGRGAAEAERAERGEAEERRRGHASTKEEGSLFDALVIAATGSADGAQGEGGEEGEERENGQGRGAEVGGERCGRGEGLPRREDGDSKPVEQGTGKRSREGAEEEGAKRARAGEGGDGWDARGAEVWVAEVFRLRAALHSTEMQLAEHARRAADEMALRMEMQGLLELMQGGEQAWLQEVARLRVQLHEAHQANALLQETMAANAAHWRMILRQIAPLMDHVPGLMQGREREHGAEGGVEGGEGRGVASEGREGPQNRGSADGGGDWDAREADAEGRGGDARAGRDGSAHDSREGTSELVGEASPNDGRATPESQGGGGDRNEDVTTSPLYGAPTRSPSAAGGRGAAQRDDGSQEEEAAVHGAWDMAFGRGKGDEQPTMHEEAATARASMEQA